MTREFRGETQDNIRLWYHGDGRELSSIVVSIKLKKTKENVILFTGLKKYLQEKLGLEEMEVYHTVEALGGGEPIADKESRRVNPINDVEIGVQLDTGKRTIEDISKAMEVLRKVQEVISQNRGLIDDKDKLSLDISREVFKQLIPA